MNGSARSGRLLGWFAAHGRDLPWRDVRDPWSILVSEVMLQQTGADRIVPRWAAFLDRWPTVQAAAAADLDDLLAAWDGLGYPRRVRNLREAARRIVADHDGRVPDDLDELLALPGIGPYTARAVLAFAYEQDVAVVDTNVGRILARTEGRTLRARDAQALADQLVPDGHGWAWNQALLDLGAMVCRKVAPECSACPWQPDCAWRGSGPDPAAGSAGVSGRQPRYEGSDRQLRGEIIRRLRAGSQQVSTLIDELSGWDEARVVELIDALEAEQFLRRDGERLRIAD